MHQFNIDWKEEKNPWTSLHLWINKINVAIPKQTFKTQQSAMKNEITSHFLKNQTSSTDTQISKNLIEIHSANCFSLVHLIVKWPSFSRLKFQINSLKRSQLRANFESENLQRFFHFHGEENLNSSVLREKKMRTEAFLATENIRFSSVLLSVAVWTLLRYVCR